MVRHWGVYVVMVALFAGVAEAGDRVIVRFQPGTTPAAKSRALLRAGATKGLDLDNVNAVAADLPGAAGRAALAADPSVAAIEDDAEVRACAETIPWGASFVWGPSAPGSGSPSVKVAILDTGIDLDHPDLSPNVHAGPTYVNGTFTPDDDNGHGSHVAGTVGAAGGNGIGSHGVAPGVELWAVKVLNRKGSGSLSGVIAALGWAGSNGMDAANLSLTASGDGNAMTTLRQAVINARGQGVVVCCAAGNSNRNANLEIPGGYAESYTVGAVDSSLKSASFSNFGAKVDLAGPGVSIYSTYKNGTYKTLNGTSMATPHVTAVVAEYVGDHPGSTPDQTEAVLTLEAKQHRYSGTKDLGDGVVHIVD